MEVVGEVLALRRLLWALKRLSLTELSQIYTSLLKSIY